LQSQLAATTNIQQQKQILGENLFPKIQAIQPELAGKITGMLLEMDNNELVNLLDDEAALLAKVNEAMAVYDEYVKSQQGQQGQGQGPAQGEAQADKPKEEKAEEKA
jgi:polyadenylate-binding protein